MRFEISSYISSNPSPSVFLISGKAADVDAVLALAEPVPGCRIVARAQDGQVAFVRFELSATTTYADFMEITVERRRRRLLGTCEQKIPTSSDGRSEDVGNPHTPPVIVGLIGGGSALQTLRAELSWAQLHPLVLEDGRGGLWFEPPEGAWEEYDRFVEAAASGRFSDVEVVLLARAGDGAAGV